MPAAGGDVRVATDGTPVHDDAEEQFAHRLALARAGDPRGFDALVGWLERPLVGFLRARGSDDGEALANEVLVRAFTRIDTFSGNAVQFRAWVFRIARNARSYRRDALGPTADRCDRRRPRRPRHRRGPRRCRGDRARPAVDLPPGPAAEAPSGVGGVHRRASRGRRPAGDGRESGRTLRWESARPSHSSRSSPKEVARDALPDQANEK